MDNYTPSTLSTASKKAARFIQRTRWVMNLQRDIYDINKELKSLNDEAKANTKTLAIAEFKNTQADKNNDPRADTLKKNFETATERFERQEKDIKAETESYTKSIAKLEEEIAKVMAGDLKVSSERQTELAKELVQTRVEVAHNNGEFDDE